MPFHIAMEPAVNPEPLTVNVKAAPPACAVAGLIPEMVGRLVPAVIVKAAVFDVAPLAITAIVADPALEIRLAPTEAVSWLALTNDVGSAAPFHTTVAPPVKPEPLTVSVNPALPDCADAGLTLVMVGRLVTVEIVKPVVFEVAPFAVTATVADPAEAIRPALTEAVS